jgi:hypothetical protein
MSQQDNLTIVKDIYDAVGRGDVAAILDRVSDDVDWAAEAASKTAPCYGPRAGRDGVASFFSDLASSIEIGAFTPHSFAARPGRRPPARGLDHPVGQHGPRSIDDHAPLLAHSQRQGNVLPRQRGHRADRPGPRRMTGQSAAPEHRATAGCAAGTSPAHPAVQPRWFLLCRWSSPA